MAKKSQQSALKTFLSHPFPGVRLEKPKGQSLAVTLGRPGLLSKTFTKNRSEAEPDLASTEMTPQQRQRHLGLGRSKAERLWLKGADRIEAGDHQGALECFEQALERDPSLTDALLGIHLVDPLRPGLLEGMLEGIDRFGDCRDRFGRRLYSFYQPLAFASVRLELADDVRRARAKELSLAGDHEDAEQLLGGCIDCPLTEMGWARLHFARADWERCLQVLQSIGIASGELGLDLLLFRGICLRNLGMLSPAVEALTAAVNDAERQALGRMARYERAVAYELAGELDQARVELEAIYAEDVTYRDVAQRLAALNARTAEQQGTGNQVATPQATREPIAEATGELAEAPADEDPFEAIVRSLESGQLADDPDLPDNRAGEGL